MTDTTPKPNTHPKRFSGSIRRRLMFALMGLALFSSLMIAGTTLSIAYRNGRAQAVDRLEAVAVNKAAQIEVWVASLHSELRMALAHPSAVADARSICIHSDVDDDATRKRLQSWFVHTLELADSIERITLIDLDGRGVVSTDPALEGSSRRLQPYFREGLRHPVTLALRQTYAATGEQLDAIVAAKPVHDDTGRAVGVLVGLARMGRLNDVMVERSGLGTTGESYLVNTAKILMTQSRYSGFEAGNSFVHSDVIDATIENRSRVSILANNYTQTPVLAVSHWLPDLELALIAEQEQWEALATVYEGLWAGLSAAGIALLAALLMAAFLARTFTTPILGLADAAAHLTEGRWGKHVAVERSDEIGQLAYTFNTMSSELERSFATIQQREEHLRQVVGSMPVLLDAFDEDGTVIAWNEECERVTGYSAEEIVGNPDAMKLLYPDDKLRDEVMLTIKKAGGDFRNLELTLTARDGTPRTIAWSNVSKSLPIRGWATWAVGIDVTERRHLEERLQHAQKMDAIGQLAGGVAHDFNNQLGGIMGYVDLLCRHLNDDRLLRWTEGIRSATMRSADLTQQLLAFARKGKYRHGPVEIHRLIGETVQMLERSIDKRIRVRQVLAARPAVVQGDATQLQNALLNLGLNARDAMPGGGTLTFETDVAYRQDIPGEDGLAPVTPVDCLVVQVSDTGCGMSEEVRTRACEPFFTTKEVGQGTGMGLAAVYGTVKNHGGTVSVYSEPDHGTTVKIMLPFGSEVPVPEPSPPGEAVEVGNLRILVIEDEAIVRNSLREVLETNGHEVVEATDGREGLELYRQRGDKIDLVILDLVMPEMNGRDCFRELKMVDPDVTVLLSSGYSINGEAQELLSEGVAGFIQKPFKLRELLRTISGVIGSQNKKPPGPRSVPGD